MNKLGLFIQNILATVRAIASRLKSVEQKVDGIIDNPPTSTDTLDVVAQRDNISRVSLQIEGEDGLKSILDSYYLRFVNIKGSILGGIIVNDESRSEPEYTAILKPGGLQAVRIYRENKSWQSAVDYGYNRVSGADAVVDRDFVTLRQLKSYDPEIVDSPEYSMVEYKDLFLVTVENVEITLPDIHPEELEDWNGRKFKIVAHKTVRLSEQYIDLLGKGESTAIEAGQSVELMFLNDQWYEV